MASSTAPPQNLNKSLVPVRFQWEIEFARFFNFPRRLSSTSSSLRPLPKSKYRTGGTWLSASTIASLRLMTDSTNPDTILIVTLGGRMLEEHFMGNLHFSWPQVSCVSQCPTRGSRVVFASYRDCAGQIQKFALRFETSCHAQTFIDALKDNLKVATETELRRSDFGSDIASQSEFASSNELQYRAEEVNYLDPVATMPPMLDYTSNQNTCSQEALHGSSLEGIPGDLPPSFTALLTNSAEAELALIVDSAVKASGSDELDLKSQIMRYMSDSSFHDMLIKVEEVIHEMGGDLAL